MSRSSILFHGLLAGILLCSASPARPAAIEATTSDSRGSWSPRPRNPRSIRTTLARYGVMAEIARSMLEKREQQADLVLERDNLNIEMAKFPPKKWWLAEHHEVHNRKLYCDQQLALLKRQIEELDLQQRRMYEAELDRAKVSKKRVRPIRREAILDELNKLDAQCEVAFAELRDGIDAAAKEELQSSRRVGADQGKAGESLPSARDARRGAAGVRQTDQRGRWLDGGKEPSRGKANRCRSQCEEDEEEVLHGQQGHGFGR